MAKRKKMLMHHSSSDSNLWASASKKRVHAELSSLEEPTFIREIKRRKIGTTTTSASNPSITLISPSQSQSATVLTKESE